MPAQEQFANYTDIYVSVDPQKNGNCQFEAIANQLRSKYAVFKKTLFSTITGDVVRKNVVQYMEKFPTKFQNFHCGSAWIDYLTEMKKTTTFGDHLTLYAASFVFDVNFLVLDATDKNKCLLLSTGNNDEQQLEANLDTLCVLGYYPEGEGAHYVSLCATSMDSLFEIAKLVGEVRRNETNRIENLPSYQVSDVRTKAIAEPIKSTENTDQCTEEPQIVVDQRKVCSQCSAEDCTGNKYCAPNGVQLKSWQEWTKTRPWLISKLGKVYCSVCQKLAGRTIALRTSESREDSAFTTTGVQALTAKKLLKKIDKHAKSRRHEDCMLNEKIIAEEKTKKAFALQTSRFEELHADKIAVTEKVFRVAYVCAKENLAFTKHPAIIECHKLNGTNMGSLLFSPVTCQDIITHISKEMRALLIHEVIKSETYFSIMVDESTTISSKCTLIIYIRILFDEEVTNYFLDLVELEDKSGNGIAKAIFETLLKNGLNIDILHRKFIGFASDGASALRGIYMGAATCLQQLIGTKFVTFHCMAHRLELAVHCVVKNVKSVSHFRILCDEFHSIYAHSSKRLLELNSIAKELSIQILKLGKVFDVRWLMSTYNSVNALWTDLAALQKHMDLLSNDCSILGKEKAKFSGLGKKLKSWLVVSELALMRDALNELRRFSLHLQHRDTTIMMVGAHKEILLRALESMKETCGSTLEVVMNATADYEKLKDNNSNCCLVLNSNAIVTKPSTKEENDFGQFKKQFLQGLIDNIQERFPDSLITAVDVLDSTTWPQDDVKRALYGDKEIMELATAVRLDVSIIHHLPL